MHQTLMNGSKILVVMLLATVTLLSYTERHLVEASTSAISPSPTVTVSSVGVTVGSNQTFVPTSSAAVQTTAPKSDDDDDAKKEKEKKKISMIAGGCAGSFVVIVGILVVVYFHRKENQD
ncbi:uncharacterized protein LOC116306304 [Actinia tenebrosa]|uniref:Uncharacterized protein LOC116306304 n=1 Tax=Actinia tenebrosa TaxID=6105 RepID=A0A6P8IXQ7_ACTTE|nr:uncharacterized protein LOC116306304 [Actinia tenebrosa]XP_031572197.1 uncharacterized protein LOC116306304 [Actinia tenebrosa]